MHGCRKYFVSSVIFVFSHMNDVLVQESNENDHLGHLKTIFQKIREAGLKKSSLNVYCLKDIYNI